MKTLIGAIALTLAAPALAQTAQAPEPKQDCCEKMKSEGKECCCKDMAGKGHEAHDMKSDGERGHDGHGEHAD
mgnify:CR=1 FL=1